jgi:nucleotide-binding universal stress UspA family protein
MTTRILAVYDRSPLGNLAVETAFHVACSNDDAVLHVLAISTTSSDAEQRETLDDDLLAFVQVGRRLGVAVDGAVMDMPDTERFVTEMRQRQINHLVIAKPAGQDGGTAISRMLDDAATSTGTVTTVVREESE